MAAICYSSIRGLASRATRLDVCGIPVTGGATNKAVTCGFVKIELASQVEDGDEFLVKGANGELCINKKGAPALKRYDMTMDFCQVDPEFFELVAGVRLLTDPAGKSVGFTVDDDPRVDKFALEVWSEVPGSACSGGLAQYLYWLLPYVENGITGDFTIENGPVTFPMLASTAGANTPGWGRGPYNVVPIDVGGTPGILPAPGVLAGEHLLQRLTTVAPPACACGYA